MLVVIGLQGNIDIILPSCQFFYDAGLSSFVLALLISTSLVLAINIIWIFNKNKFKADSVRLKIKLLIFFLNLLNLHLD
ncbi:hypothetical protein SHM_21340 [Spiroplasma ixodetis]|uniref:Uncharacterized protein n=1 Tax=Spiroplasma ixodetis TaxID=2141 RepID=A0ABM8BX93_9MOLU|nr:hypothetical protein SHM_21340 [Spiroplasma ixodetis]